MLIEITIIVIIVIVIMAIFYVRTVDEYRINQVEWNNGRGLSDVKKLLWERVPIIVKHIPVINCWTKSDREIRSNIYWSSSNNVETIAKLSGVKHWFSKEKLSDIFTGIIPIPAPIISAECHIGNKGLFMTRSENTCIIPTDNNISVCIIKKSMLNNLPMNWEGREIDSISLYDTPFAGDIKYIEIIVKKGMMLMMPPNWIISIKTDDMNDGYVIIHNDIMISAIIKRIRKN